MEYKDVGRGMGEWMKFQVAFSVFRKSIDGVASCEEVTRRSFIDSAYRKVGEREEKERRKLAEAMGNKQFNDNVSLVINKSWARISKMLAEECLLDDGVTELNFLLLKQACNNTTSHALQNLALWSNLNRSMTTFQSIVIPYIARIPLCPPLPETALDSYPAMSPQEVFSTSLNRQGLMAAASFLWQFQKLSLGVVRGKVSFGGMLRSMIQYVRKTSLGMVTRAVAAVVVQKAGFNYRWETVLNLLLTAALNYGFPFTKIFRFSITDDFSAWCSASLLQTENEAAFWPWLSTASSAPIVPFVEEIMQNTPVPELRAPNPMGFPGFNQMPPMPMPPQMEARPHVPDLD